MDLIPFVSVINLNDNHMLPEFFKTAIRYLWQKKTYSTLNFICLTFGLACAIIVTLYVLNVSAYDKFHKNYTRLYAVDAYVTFFNGERFPKEYLSASLSGVLEENAPEIESVTRIAEKEFSFNNSSFTEKGYYADKNFFDVFTFPLENGNSEALSDLNSIMISERMAERLFGKTDCIGKSLSIPDNNNQTFTVSGVFSNVPHQSVLQFDFVIPFSRFIADDNRILEPGATANATWILLKENIDYRFVEGKIKNLIKDQESTLNQELFLFPLKEQILYSYAGGRRVWKEMQNVVIAGCIGLAILLIACFNFLNLAIALNFRRYREAGIKKAFGSDRFSIVLQFLGETLIITIISCLFAIALAKALLTGLNSLLNFDIPFHLADFKVITLIVAILLITSILAGLLPALYLASVNPVNALKGKIINAHSFSLLRQSLIIFQFAIPVVLIIFMMIIKTQDSYMRNYDAGVDKEKLIIVENSPAVQSHSESVKAGLLTIPGVEAVSFTNCIPLRGTRVSSEVSWPGKDASEKLHFWCINSDCDFNKTVKIKISEGRFFHPSFSTDSASYMVNDIALKVMKIEKPVGTAITVEGRKGIIIGVFKDFHAIDLAGPLVPAIMGMDRSYCPYILVKFSSGSYHEMADQINKIYSQYEHKASFKATLFKDLTPYSDLSTPARLVGIAFFIALALASMGFFGLASFTSDSRTKEIGIRKVNGATTFSVMLILLKSFTKWLVFAFVIAVPIAILIGNKFLGKFHYHTPLPLWAFIAGPLIAFLIALATVSYRTLRAACQNPVKALRHE